MAKRGRRSFEDRLAVIGPALLRDVRQWVDSDRRYSAVEIHRKFDLVGHGISLRSFSRWVSKRRKEQAETGRADYGTPQGGTDAEGLVLGLLIQRAEAGDPKHMASIASALRALCDFRRLGFDEAAEKRAAEIHEEKMAEIRELKAQADSGLDRIAVAKGIPDDVRNAIKDVYGLTIDPVTPGDIRDKIDQVMRGEAPADSKPSKALV